MVRVPRTSGCWAGCGWVFPLVIPRAPGQIRTAGTRFRRAVLYPLSYGGDVAFFNHDHQV